jgi:hypothetical protein
LENREKGTTGKWRKVHWKLHNLYPSASRPAIKDDENEMDERVAHIYTRNGEKASRNETM